MHKKNEYMIEELYLFNFVIYSFYDVWLAFKNLIFF